MNREGHNQVKYFIGPEVEHTPAFSKKTLFVVGKQPVDEIISLARKNKTPHVFMGANHSFSVDVNDGTLYWDETITKLLDQGFWVTLDYQAHEHQHVLMMLNAGIWQSRLFVPLLSVRIPKVQTSSPNLTVKIDDVDFKATNPGVWCMHFHEVTDSNRFTDWQDYGTDEIITETVEEATILPAGLGEVTKTSSLVPPVSNLDKTLTAEESFKTPVQNDASLGLDTEAKSMLKAESDEEKAEENPKAETPQEAAEMYAGTGSADGAKEVKKKGKK